MHRGYVKVWRKLRDTGIIQDGPSSQFFLKAVLDAAHTKTRRLVGKALIILEPGEFIFGRGQWAADLEVSEKVLRRVLKNFEKWAIIRASKRASKYTVYKLVNWDTYQSDDDGVGPGKGQQEGQQRASRGPHKKNGEEYLNTRESETIPDAATPPNETPPQKSPPQQGPKKTPYPSKGRPSYRTFKSCLGIYPGDVVEDEAWVAWCDMEDGGMLDEDMNFIRDLLIGLAQDDDRWREGFAPSFAKCIKTRAWRKKPFKRPNNGAQSPAQSGQPTQPRATTQAQANAQTRKGLAKALNAKRRERHGEGQPGQIDGGDGGSCPELPGVNDRGGRDCSLAPGMDNGPRALDGEAIPGGGH